MKSVHFFKIYSRFGLVNPPFKWTEMNYGVEDGPDAILSNNFLSEFSSSVVSEFTFPTYEDIAQKNYKSILAASLKDCTKFIEKNLTLNQRQVIVGGDHSVTFPSFAAVLKRHDPKKVGYIQFDSQGDIHTFSSSHSGNFHGMFVRAFVDTFDYGPIEALIPKKLPIENVLFIGNLDLEIEEVAYFKEKKIRNIVKEEMKNTATLAEVLQFVQRFKHIHITFDVDVFHNSLVTATGTPAPDGWMKREIFKIVSILRIHPSISFDLVEVNPKKKNAAPTVELAQEILKFVLL